MVERWFRGSHVTSGRTYLDWNAAARYGELNYRISRTLADADQRPLWYKGDYFGDRFAPDAPRAAPRP